MAFDVSKMNQPENEDKGHENGSCNRRACQAPNARWYNHGSMAWYCDYCRHDIEFDSFNLRNWQVNHQPRCGHPMFETREMIEAREANSVHTMARPAREGIYKMPEPERKGKDRPRQIIRHKKLFRA